MLQCFFWFTFAVKATTTQKPTTTSKAPVITSKTTTTERVTALGQTGDNSLNMPAIIGGSVSGLVLLLLILLVLLCGFIRRWRSENEEKVRGKTGLLSYRMSYYSHPEIGVSLEG